MVVNVPYMDHMGYSLNSTKLPFTKEVFRPFMEEFLCQTIYLLGSSVGRGYTKSFAPTKPVTNAMVHVTF